MPLQMQGSYIGNTTASQAVKAGSTPVPCSKKKPPSGGFSFWSGRESKGLKVNDSRTLLPNGRLLSCCRFSIIPLDNPEFVRMKVLCL